MSKPLISIDKSCKIEGCEQHSRKLKMCLKHYKRFRSHGEAGLALNFHCSKCNSSIAYKAAFQAGLCLSCYGESYYKENIDKWSLTDEERTLKNEYGKQHYRANREAELAYDKAYSAKPENKKRRALRFREYRKEREKRDPEYKLRRILRNRLNAALNGNFKSGSAVRDLGCTIEELKTHLELQFHHNPETGEMMTWDNYSHEGWHIDHIEPLCAFDLTDYEQLKLVCHYNNLRPSWKKENLSKATEDKSVKSKRLK